MPIFGWGTDLTWNGTDWNLYRPKEAPDSEANTYRLNSYRVLLTRGRDGFIIFVPDDRELDSTYNLLKEIGLLELKKAIIMSIIEKRLEKYLSLQLFEL